MNNTHEFKLEGTVEECPTCGHGTESEYEEIKVTVQTQDTKMGGRLLIQFNGQFVASINRNGIYRHRYAGEATGVRFEQDGRICDRSDNG